MGRVNVLQVNMVGGNCTAEAEEVYVYMQVHTGVSKSNANKYKSTKKSLEQIKGYGYSFKPRQNMVTKFKNNKPLTH